MSNFKVGQQPVITATFSDVTGGSAVATAATFMVHDPLGTETSTSSPDSAITNPSSNVWKFVMDELTEAGPYVIRVKTTSGLTAAQERTITVAQSGFTDP